MQDYYTNWECMFGDYFKCLQGQCYHSTADRYLNSPLYISHEKHDIYNLNIFYINFRRNYFDELRQIYWSFRGNNSNYYVLLDEAKKDADKVLDKFQKLKVLL